MSSFVHAMEPKNTDNVDPLKALVSWKNYIVVNKTERIMRQFVSK